MIIENAFENAKKHWIEQIEKLTYEDMKKDEPFVYIFSRMGNDAASFKRISQIQHYFTESVPQKLEPEQPLEDEVSTEENISPESPYADDAFTFERMVRGGQLFNINNPSDYIHQVYIPENIVREWSLVTGDIVLADVKLISEYRGKYNSSIREVIERVESREESEPFTHRLHLLVERDHATGDLYASRYATGGFVKNEDEDIMRYDITEAESKRYHIEEGSIVDISIDGRTNYHCVSYVHSTLGESSPEPKKKAKRESEAESDAESKTTIFDGINYDLEKLRGQRLVLVSKPNLSSRYESVFEKQLGMDLYFYSDDKDITKMKKAIENSADYAIACPCATGHAASEALREVANEHGILNTFTQGDGPKQVLLSLVLLAERKDFYALSSEF